MNFKPTIIFILFFSLLGNSAQSQSLSKTWYCTKNNVCITIDSATNCFTIVAGLDCSRSKYKRKGDKLIVKLYTNQTILGWKKEKAEFQIAKLTNDTLQLTLIRTKDLELLETLGLTEKDVNAKVLFDFKHSRCENGN